MSVSFLCQAHPLAAVLLHLQLPLAALLLLQPSGTAVTSQLTATTTHSYLKRGSMLDSNDINDRLQFLHSIDFFSYSNLLFSDKKRIQRY